MNSIELKKRTKDFALSIIRLLESLPPVKTSDVIGRQLLRSATSVGANYRAACRARSKAEFLSKISIVEEEADESLYWLELLQESHLLSDSVLQPFLKEADELTAIFTAASITAKKNRNAAK